jgi:queuine/archaeosine tRNA-ribosyltransferase
LANPIRHYLKHSFSTKSDDTFKEAGWHDFHRKKQAIVTASGGAQCMDVADKGVKALLVQRP